MICYGPRVYEGDVLAGNWRRPGKGKIPKVPAEMDLVVEDADSGFCGAVVACDKEAVTLEDRFGKRRLFPLAPAAFLLEGKPVTLVRPAAAPAAPRRSASGSVAVEGLRARVARQSRIYVEGVHDAALVEKIWGHDLRVEGVVVEYLEGVDDLPAIVAEFGPEPGQPAGRAGGPPGARLQGEQDRRRDHLAGRARGGASVHRHLAGGQTLRAAHPRLAGRAARGAVEGGRDRGPGLADGAGCRPGGAFSAPSRRTRTWSRNCSAGSRN